MRKTAYWKCTCEARRQEDCDECVQCKVKVSMQCTSAQHSEHVHTPAHVAGGSKFNLTFSSQFLLCFIKTNIPARLFFLFFCVSSAQSHIQPDKDTHHRNIFIDYSHVNVEPPVCQRPLLFHRLVFLCNLPSGLAQRIVFLDPAVETPHENCLLSELACYL